MKFKAYLNEDKNIALAISETIKKDCRVYLNMISRLPKGSMLMRGSRERIPYFKMMTPRIDRLPSDMPMPYHTAFDEAFAKKVGWKVRSEGVFCSLDPSQAADYTKHIGNVYFCFPIGKFKYTFNKEVGDLWTEVLDKFIEKMWCETDPYPPVEPEFIDKLVKGYKTSGWPPANSEIEIAIKCNKYYLVDGEITYELMGIFGMKDKMPSIW